MGISHFTFYNTNGMAPNVINVVEEARRYGLSIEVLPWNYQSSRTHEYDQYMAINACLYWQAPFFDHSLMVDLDEYIVARGPEIRSIPEMLAELDEKHPNAASYLFRHFLFHPIDNVMQRDPGAIELFSVNTRHNESYLPGKRSKVICKSDRVITSTIHTIAESMDPYKETPIDPNFAAMFHFRSKDLGDASLVFSVDTEMMKFYDLFMNHPLARRYRGNVSERI